MRKVLIIAITRLGDLLQASPTIAGMKEEYPDCHITMLTDKGFSSICHGIPGIDDIYEMNLSAIVRLLDQGPSGIVDAYKYLDDAVSDLKAKDFDFCLNMASSAYTALLLKMLDIKDSRGWISDDEGFRLISSPWSMLFAANVFHSNRDFNSINLVDFVRCSTGIKKHPKKLQYTVPEDAESFVDEFLATEVADSSGPLIFLQAGASQEKRQWAPARFSYVIRHLVEDLDARVVLTGTAKELGIIEAILKGYNHPQVAVAAGKTKLNQLAALLKRGDLLITGDTGPMHLAVAVGTPVVALFLASALCFETGPYSEGNFVLQPQIACNPCNPNFPCSRPDCHVQLTPELVVYLSKLRLNTPRGEEQSISLSKDVADPEQVAVYVTQFDSEGFLGFRQLNGRSPRKGLPSETYESARASYRRLWRDEFNTPEVSNGSHPRLPVLQNVQDSPHLSGLGSIIELCGKGEKVLEQLDQLIKDPKSPPQLLGQANDALCEIDRNIEDIGLSNPVLGALTRMFVIEKENMRGEDPMLLASEMKELYTTLNRRAYKFGEFFDRYAAEITSN